jgi:hypothetical protein
VEFPPRGRRSALGAGRTALPWRLRPRRALGPPAPDSRRGLRYDPTLAVGWRTTSLASPSSLRRISGDCVSSCSRSTTWSWRSSEGTARVTGPTWSFWPGGALSIPRSCAFDSRRRCDPTFSTRTGTRARSVCGSTSTSDRLPGHDGSRQCRLRGLRAEDADPGEALRKRDHGNLAPVVWRGSCPTGTQSRGVRVRIPAPAPCGINGSINLGLNCPRQASSWCYARHRDPSSTRRARPDRVCRGMRCPASTGSALPIWMS